eukprot:CAMPEP_0196820880 /NCGR_PEP_ID=MMETSP1362-20130617/76938_1 /TAXON_ID=163516 /ORGANISM="Leptocylindrus danicus, Strain CCMP1856" /LENGTH=553 /DNA_ID=CAMNT_0042199903 /DNA_START=97 /DNA_END=1761 /DNA_ORIENTATION=-
MTSLQKALSDNNAQADTSLCYTLSPDSKSDGGISGQNRQMIRPGTWAHQEDDHFSAIVSNNSTTASSQKSRRKNAPCKFFAKGNCKFGDACKFEHISAKSPGQQSRATASSSSNNKPTTMKDMLQVDTSILEAGYRPVAVTPDPEHQLVYVQRSDVAKVVPEIFVPAGYHPIAFDDVTCLTHDSGDKVFADGRYSRSSSEERQRMEYNAWLEHKKANNARDVHVDTAHLRPISPISVGTAPTPTASTSLAAAVQKTGGTVPLLLQGTGNQTVVSNESRANSAYMSPDEDEVDDEDYSNASPYVITKDSQNASVKAFYSRKASTSSTVDTMSNTVEGTSSISSVKAMREALELKTKQGNTSMDLNMDTFYMKQRKKVMEENRRKSESMDTLHSYRGNFMTSGEEDETHLSAERKIDESRSLFVGSRGAFTPTYTDSVDDDSYRGRQFVLRNSKAKGDTTSERSRVSVFPHDYVAVDCLSEQDASIVSSSESFFKELRRKQKLQKDASNPFKKLMCCLAPWMMNEQQVAIAFSDDDYGNDEIFVTTPDYSYSVIA